MVVPWMWGLLPENDAVLARWARRFGVSDRSPFALLSTPVGHDCAGLVGAAPDAFAQAAGEVGDLGRPLPAALTDAVAARATRCASTLR